MSFSHVNPSAFGIDWPDNARFWDSFKLILVSEVFGHAARDGRELP